jgi:ribose/xylose/arabinose/galactoside ABC-type transport system permease subunit
VLRNGCNLAGVDNYVQNIVIGSIIIIAVGIDQLKHGRQS